MHLKGHFSSKLQSRTHITFLEPSHQKLLLKSVPSLCCLWLCNSSPKYFSKEIPTPNVKWFSTTQNSDCQVNDIKTKDVLTKSLQTNTVQTNIVQTNIVQNNSAQSKDKQTIETRMHENGSLIVIDSDTYCDNLSKNQNLLNLSIQHLQHKDSLVISHPEIAHYAQKWNITKKEVRQLFKRARNTIRQTETQKMFMELDEETKTYIQLSIHSTFDQFRNNIIESLPSFKNSFKQVEVSKKIGGVTWSHASQDSQVSQFKSERSHTRLRIEEIYEKIRRVTNLDRNQLGLIVKQELSSLYKQLIRHTLNDCIKFAVINSEKKSVSSISKRISSLMNIPNPLIYETVRSHLQKERRKTISRYTKKFISDYVSNSSGSVSTISEELRSKVQIPLFYLREIVSNEIQKREIRKIDVETREKILQQLNCYSQVEPMSSICDRIASQLSIPRYIIYYIVRNHQRHRTNQFSSDELQVIRDTIREIKSPEQFQDVYNLLEMKLNIPREQLYQIVHKEYFSSRSLPFTQEEKKLIQDQVIQIDDRKDLIERLTQMLPHLTRRQISRKVFEASRKLQLPIREQEMIQECIYGFFPELQTKKDISLPSSLKKEVVKISDIVDHAMKKTNLPRHRIYYHVEKEIHKAIRRIFTPNERRLISKVVKSSKTKEELHSMFESTTWAIGEVSWDTLKFACNLKNNKPHQ